MLYIVIYCKNKFPRKIKRFKTRYDAQHYMITKYCKLIGIDVVDDIFKDLKSKGYSTRGGGCILSYGVKYTNRWMNEKHKIIIVPFTEPTTI